jgi:plastocyanin
VRNPPNNIRYGVPILLVSFGVCAVLLFGAVQLVKTPPAASAGGSTSVGTAGGPASVTVVAKDLKFDKGQIAVATGAQVTLTLDNEDPGVSHNISFFPSNRATSATDRIAGLDPFAGVARQDLKFTAPSKAGKYFFRCDVHPDTMSGQLVIQ